MIMKVDSVSLTMYHSKGLQLDPLCSSDPLIRCNLPAGPGEEAGQLTDGPHIEPVLGPWQCTAVVPALKQGLLTLPGPPEVEGHVGHLSERAVGTLLQGKAGGWVTTAAAAARLDGLEDERTQAGLSGDNQVTHPLLRA